MKPDWALGYSATVIALASGVALACSSPPAPTIPSRDKIGPPPEASADCLPPTTPFAQHYFRIADLDRGASCVGFIEQDECVLAFFHDCTFDQVHPRSWVGSIDHANNIALYATYNTHQGIGARDPNECCGTLVVPKDGPIWAKLGCVIGGGDAMAHAGFYFERIDDTPAKPFYRLDPANGIRVAMPSMPADGFLPDFVVLENANQLWAISNVAGSSAIYSGPTSGPLTRSSMSVTTPTQIRSSKDEHWILIADGSVLHHFPAAGNGGDMSMTADGAITEVEVIGDQVLLATRAPSNTTHLRLYAIDTLQPSSSETTIPNQIIGIVPLVNAVSTPTSAMALVIFDTPDVATIDSTLTITSMFTPNMMSAPTGYLLVDPTTLGLSYGARYLEFDLFTRKPGIDVKIPVGDIRGLAYDHEKNTVVTGSPGGAISVIDRMGMRPILASQITLPDHGTASKVVFSSKANGLYVLGGATGAIYPLVR